MDYNIIYNGHQNSDKPEDNNRYIILIDSKRKHRTHEVNDSKYEDIPNEYKIKSIYRKLHRIDDFFFYMIQRYPKYSLSLKNKMNETLS